MFGISLQGAVKTRNALIGLFGKLKQAAEFVLWQAAQNIRDEMREPGDPIVYPVQWDSTKQRKAFFATNGFGRGIPTKRTGGGVAAWKAIKTEDGAQVENPLSHIVFINGRRQSKIHRGRWKILYTVVESVLKRLPADLVKRMTVTIEEQGFKAI